MQTRSDPESGTALAFQRQLTDDNFETSFRHRYPIIWLLTLIGPFAVTVAVFALIFAVDVVEKTDYFWQVVWAAIGSFFVAGKFIILGGSEYFLTSGQLFAMVVYMDVMTAMLLAFHTGFLFKLPILGSKLRDLVEDGQFILRSHPWMKRATFAGIIAFVMFPLAATGSIGGSIFGRLLGMSRIAILAGITIGSVLGCGIMYFGAELINRYVDKESQVLKIGGIAFIVILVLILNYRYRTLKAEHLAERARTRT